MNKTLKTIAFFGCRLTSRYRNGLVKAFNDVADEMGVNLLFFHSIGQLGDSTLQYAQYEQSLIDFMDLDQFDGIVFDGEGYITIGMADKVIKTLRKAKCPVVSISSHVDGFINIEFEDAKGLRVLIEHFLDHHHFTKIGFMSGLLSHPDAVLRLNEFRSVMRERGYPEDGVGMFEGDFWFNMGDKAADYFLSLPERPEAVVCANDYMAIALINSFRERGIEVPRDIAVSGYDGTVDGEENFPKLTTATRERYDIARKAIGLILDHINGKPDDTDLHIYPRGVFEQSCGCAPLLYKPQTVSKMYVENRGISHSIRLSETALLRLSMAANVKDIENVFATNSSNFGEFNSFFLMVYMDKNGVVSYNEQFTERSDKLKVAIFIDKYGIHRIPEYGISRHKLIPDCLSDQSQSYYMMSVHSINRLFGYALVSMKSKEIYNEFYNLWITNMAMILENILKNSRIDKLIESLREMSTKDGLTGMLNRRGFDFLSYETLRSSDRDSTVCTMVIDMDGLKRINDAYGHHEGDNAIKAVAEIITECCDSGEICARTGGDEFFIFAPDYSEEKLSRFTAHLNENIIKYNKDHLNNYEISVSYGSHLVKADTNTKLEDMLRISDIKMYRQKHSKPNRR